MKTVDYYQEKAQSLHNEGYNCAQSALIAYEELLPDFDRPTLVRISEGLGAGIGGHKGTCGAITGSAILLSLLTASGDVEHNLSKQKTYELAGTLVNRFEETCGSTTCATLRGEDKENGEPLLSCAQCINHAIAISADLIKEQHLQ
ncbi:MAG: C-GCAxxG-C-C family protein [Spirochaetia bacterium]|jgi:C_GCAxxG_C_C family probable redox protein|nr:C-GCAxxG-C-C family protein [Spirochaetia bacterium]